MTPTEVKRIKDCDEAPDINCLTCGKLIHLRFNGGELDRRVCCGLTYQQAAQGYDLVVTRGW